MEERPSYFSILTADVRYDKRLSASEKILYSEITALTNKEGYCYATNGYFAKLYDCTEKTISIQISNLAKCGYISVMIEDGYKRKIYINMGDLQKCNTPIEKNVIPPLQKCNTPPLQKCKDNNTSINNTNNNYEKKEESEPQKNDFEEVAKEYDKRYPMTLSSYKAQQLSDILENYGKEAVLFAIRESLSANAKKPIEYIRSVAMNKARELENNAPAQREEKPKKKEEPKASKEFTEAMKEYQIAKNNGYAGSMFEFMNERKKRDGTCDAGLEGESVCKESETA